MKIIPTTIADLLLIKPTIFGDERGFFFESFNKNLFSQKTGVTLSFVQDNHSRSQQGVLRGLHYQVEQQQGKLVRVVRGKIFDVGVDLRSGSPTFGKWEGFEISEENHHQLWIPPGFAHGFLVLSENADVLYKTTDYYAPQYERSILWNDSTLGIAWPEGYAIQLSEKDKKGMSFEEVIGQKTTSENLEARCDA
ncbi:MAG: dTDP-4-dehydrorhamnose 3,5-epimerase [Chthoniobacterales bacterium]